ncbi:Helix-turn-helix, Fis-type protein [Novosphingobium nitrogenifigens DSM 19370]|uniref:Helix-turn-helix, Fis-type protein n=1 Tax=Novosphingobium nitrogenifigens DSM 19370 TaxID=983920 RepID=F1Z413_9SPHN|nr:sigma-54 dependent transcriptional regulator [Novosphingobium nitrogenifigens]EGD60625.1 Helix-turn-helix, Fis-type protein [Novosphingobium nitrogenifigens DSM 19370]
MTGTASLPTILIVDDEIRSLESLRRILDDEFEILTASSTREAQQLLADHWVQVILCDQRMPERSGVEFLTEVKERWPDVIRMIISGYADAHDIIDGINQAGIFQYITKPWHPEHLVLTLHSACRLFRLQRENELLAVELRMAPGAAGKVVDKRKAEVRRAYDFNDGIIRSPGSPMDDVCKALAQVAPFDVPVLLIGGSGTGKELAARALHYGSLRWDKPFVVENCGAMPDELLESELFGHKKGAFTGAIEDHVGLFERADGGTVFLDEIGEVSPAFQVKLLRVLQEGEIRPLGHGRTRKVDVRVIAATNRDLEVEMRAGRFRADLFYRLAGMIVRLPDLKDRACDLPILVDTLLDRAMASMGKNVPGVTDEAMARLAAYDWPGNVRELQNEIQRMLVRGTEGRRLGVEVLSPHVLGRSPVDAGEGAEAGFAEDLEGLTGDLKERVSAMEARIIRETLIRHRWNKSQTARELGLSRVGLRAKLERYGLENVHPLAPARRGAV